MKKWALLVSILLSSFAFAADEVTTSPVTEPDTQPTSELRLNSTKNRANKNFMVTGEVLGIGPSGVYAQGLNLGMFLNDSSLLLLELNGGKNNVSHGFLFTWGDSISQEGYSVGVHYKKFTGNSFYVKFGGDYRSIDYSYTDEFWFSSGSGSNRQFTGESLAAAFAFGNQWQMENFTIGCDWFGLEVPIASKVNNIRYDATASSYDRKDNREDIRRYVTGVGYTLLRFYLGASF
jgi:hypothetical protein